MLATFRLPSEIDGGCQQLRATTPGDLRVGGEQAVVLQGDDRLESRFRFQMPNLHMDWPVLQVKEPGFSVWAATLPSL